MPCDRLPAAYVPLIDPKRESRPLAAEALDPAAADGDADGNTNAA
jgi:hypothetical protein